MVERALREREAAERTDREDEKRVMAELNRPRSLGTLGDLIEAAREKAGK